MLKLPQFQIQTRRAFTGSARAMSTRGITRGFRAGQRLSDCGCIGRCRTHSGQGGAGALTPASATYPFLVHVANLALAMLPVGAYRFLPEPEPEPEQVAPEPLYAVLALVGEAPRTRRPGGFCRRRLATQPQPPAADFRMICGRKIGIATMRALSPIAELLG